MGFAKWTRDEKMGINITQDRSTVVPRLSNLARGKCSLNLRELCVQLVLAGLVHHIYAAQEPDHIQVR